jgi:two-component sensor histidine kinase
MQDPDRTDDRADGLMITKSLQSILALLDVQASRSGEVAVRDALETAARRIAAIGKVHASLQRCAGDRAGAIDLGPYLTGLLEESRAAPYRAGPGRTVHVAIQTLPVAPAMAQQLGLILTELMDNALRHGTCRGGRIWVTGDRLPGGVYRLCVEDDGRGLPPGFALHARRGGLGLQIVCLTAQQIGASVVADGNSGARVTLTLAVPPGEEA